VNEVTGLDDKVFQVGNH